VSKLHRSKPGSSTLVQRSAAPPKPGAHTLAENVRRPAHSASSSASVAMQPRAINADPPVSDHGATPTGPAQSGHWTDALLAPYAEPPASALQRRAAGDGGTSVGSDAGVHQIAASGVAGTGSPLPHLERIQQAFGPDHDLAHVRAHVGGDAAMAADEIGAEAYATGGHVAFRREPDLFTAAHEAAHVVQQQRGVQLFGGVGAAGDHYEQHADAVADAVVAGGSAERLLDGVAPAGDAAPSSRVQRKPRNDQPAPLLGEPPAPVWEFEPRSLTFNGAGDVGVTIRNASDDTQTIGDWEIVGDDRAFFVGLMPGIILEPGDSITFRVDFTPSGDMPQAAALILHPTFSIIGTGVPARLNMGGINSTSHQGQPDATAGACGVPISATTRSGKPNSLQSALGSVHAAWNAVLAQQVAGVGSVHGMASKDIPKDTSGWESVMDDAIAEGLVLAVGAVGLYLGGGLALATWDVLQKMQLRDDAAAAAKKIAGLTLKVHNLLVNDVTRSIGSQVSAGVRQAISDAPKGAGVPAVMREAFFLGQTKTLALAYADAVTALNNSEGDYAALEAEEAGLGFAALEAYRNHLSCQTPLIGTIQSHKTLGMWAAFLARMDLGTHDPESWEKAEPGAALDKDIFKRKNNHQEWTDELGKGVLDLHVVWDYDRMHSEPVFDIKHARVRGIHPELKAIMTTAPLREFPIPMIAHGRVKYDALSGAGATSELRVGRNEGGAIVIAAEEHKKSASMLELLGNGDVFAGAKALLDYINDLTLPEVE